MSKIDHSSGTESENLINNSKETINTNNCQNDFGSNRFVETFTDEESENNREDDDDDDDYVDEEDGSDNNDDDEDDEEYEEEEEEEDEQEEKDEETSHISPIFPGDHRFDRKYICIQYPGNVINPDKAIETLGGLSEVSTAFERKNRRLELRFRPDNGYCKPACGDRHATSGFLLRVKIKKPRVHQAENSSGTIAQVVECTKLTSISSPKNCSHNHDCTNKKNSSNSSINCNADEISNNSSYSLENIENPVDSATRSITFCNVKEEYIDSLNKSTNQLCLTESTTDDLIEYKVLGRVDTEFKFTNLCDFQYLPIVTDLKNPEKNDCIYNSIYPIGIPPLEWLEKEVPYFLPPAAFSRMDTVQQYVPKTNAHENAENVIGKTRKRRSGLSNIAYFTSDAVPDEPPRGIETAMRVKFLQSSHLEHVRKLFQERPIWSKNALMYHTRYNNEQLKILLPAVSYYCINGPWRVMWVRLGFDPRKDPSMRIYQTLDYRLKAMHGLQSSVKCKRNYAEYSLPYKSSPVAKSKTTVLMSNMSPDTLQKKEESMNENIYIYREGMVPPSRQMFYQYIDVQVSEIQEMISKLPDPLPESKCHEKHGWLPSGFDDRCREIINKQVRAVLRRMMNVPENHPTSFPTKRKFTSRPRKTHVKKTKSPSNISHKGSQSKKSQESDEEWQDVSGPSSSNTSHIRQLQD